MKNSLASASQWKPMHDGCHFIPRDWISMRMEGGRVEKVRVNGVLSKYTQVNGHILTHIHACTRTQAQYTIALHSTHITQ